MKTKILSILIFCGLFITSCDLTEKPYGFYSEDNFYKTAADAEVSLLYAYNTLNFIEYSRGIFYIGELASETCDVKSGEAYGSQDLNNWTANANNETLTNYFKYCYIGINRANAIIENVAESTFDEDAKTLDQIVDYRENNQHVTSLRPMHCNPAHVGRPDRARLGMRFFGQHINKGLVSVALLI